MTAYARYVRGAVAVVAVAMAIAGCADSRTSVGMAQSAATESSTEGPTHATAYGVSSQPTTNLYTLMFGGNSGEAGAASPARSQASASSQVPPGAQAAAGAQAGAGSQAAAGPQGPAGSQAPAGSQPPVAEASASAAPTHATAYGVSSQPTTNLYTLLFGGK